MHVTLRPFEATSALRESEKACSACFDEEYADL